MLVVKTEPRRQTRGQENPAGERTTTQPAHGGESSVGGAERGRSQEGRPLRTVQSGYECRERATSQNRRQREEQSESSERGNGNGRQEPTFTKAEWEKKQKEEKKKKKHKSEGRSSSDEGTRRGRSSRRRDRSPRDSRSSSTEGRSRKREPRETPINLPAYPGPGTESETWLNDVAVACDTAGNRGGPKLYYWVMDSRSPDISFEELGYTKAKYYSICRQLASALSFQVNSLGGDRPIKLN